MRHSLAFSLDQCVSKISSNQSFLAIANDVPAQIMLLGSQVDWSHRIEIALPTRALRNVEEHVINMLMILAEEVLVSLAPQIRKKY